MGGTELTVLVVDDDFRVANMHSGSSTRYRASR